MNVGRLIWSLEPARLNFASMKSLDIKTNLIFDLFFGLIFMPLLVVWGPPHYWWNFSPAFTALAVVYLYGCYFATKALRLPSLILSRSYRRLTVIAVTLGVLTYLLTCFPLPEVNFVIPSMSEYQTRVRNYNMAISLWFMFSVVIGYSLTVAFIKELYSRKLKQSILENQRNKAELSLLKAQINPHFLFNTLNSLYSLVIGTSQKAEDAFVKFTELLQYTYITAERDRVSVGEEIDYINNYIDLELIRLDSHTQVERDFAVDNPAVELPPMIFLTFIENAFKYGASTSTPCHILIRLHINEGQLLFETENRIMRHADEFRKTLPVGLNNCRNRLAALFPDHHSFDIDEADGLFKVHLTINLNAYE